MSGFRQCISVGFAVMWAGVSLVEAATPAAVEFSADTYQSGPKQVQRVGRIYVGKNRIRSETQQNGQPVVNIIDSDNQLTWVLYPQQQSYIEYPMGSTENVTGQKGSPCEGVPGAECKKLGDDMVQGRPATKWSVVITGQSGAMRSTQWIGKQRSILLRQEIDGGPVMEQHMQTVEQLNGRQVEKWEMTMSQGNQPAQSSTRWFDPQLNLAIKEMNAGGYVRELRNIKIGNQDPELFAIPSHFRKIIPQKPTQK
jgi:hypothetical protein